MNYRQKAKDLVNLATDERTPERERVNATVQALRLIKEHDLLASPLDALIGVGSNETVKAASSVFSHLTSPDFIESAKKVVNALGSVRKGGGAGRVSGGGRRRR
jgi:hypothetical protein